jgi:predicted dehydrogenase
MTEKREKCNVGFIGCGQLMTGQHIQNSHRSNVNRIHTLCDINEERLKFVAGKYPALKTTTKHAQLLADPEIQLVVIAMAPEKHAELALEAIKAGKDVYVEKPMGVSIHEAREIAATAKKLGRRVTTGFNRRFAPAYTDLKKFLNPRDGGLTIFYRIADRERWSRHDSPRILHEVVHIFDILCYFTDSQPVTIYANEGAHFNDNIITLSFADKSIATILSTGRTEGMPKEHVEIHWDDHSAEVEAFIQSHFNHIPNAPLVKYYGARVSDFTSAHGVIDKFANKDGVDFLRSMLRNGAQVYDDALAGKITKQDVEKSASGYLENKGWAEALDEMGRAILESRQPGNATPSDGIRSIVLAEAAYESIKKGTPVALNAKEWAV